VTVLHDGMVLSFPSYGVALEALMDPEAAPEARLAKVISGRGLPG